MKYLMAPIGLSSFIENDKDFLTRRGESLAQSAVKPFDMISFSRFFGDRHMSMRRNDPDIALVQISIEECVLLET